MGILKRICGPAPRSELWMYRTGILCFLLFLNIGCSKKPQALTPDMQRQATETVLTYLERNNLPNENLEVAISDNRDIADFTFIYTGGERCINFIVKCYAHRCTELQSYPFDRHGEACPK